MVGDGDARPKVDEPGHLPESSASIFQAYWYYQEILLYVGGRMPVVSPDGRLDHASKFDQLVHLSPAAAKELILVLADVVDQYEKQFGAIQHPRDAKITISMKPA